MSLPRARMTNDRSTWRCMKGAVEERQEDDQEDVGQEGGQKGGGVGDGGRHGVVTSPAGALAH